MELSIEVCDPVKGRGFDASLHFPLEELQTFQRGGVGLWVRAFNGLAGRQSLKHRADTAEVLEPIRVDLHDAHPAVGLSIEQPVGFKEPYRLPYGRGADPQHT